MIHTRAEWDAIRPTGILKPMGRVSALVVHRAETPDADPLPPPQRILAIQRDHMEGRRKRGLTPFLDIGYHYLIDRYGEIWTGRPDIFRGAHAGPQSNGTSLGVCLLGTDEFTAAQRRAFMEFLPRLASGFHLRPADARTWLRAHRQMPGVSTDCPGPVLESWIAELITQTGEKKP